MREAQLITLGLTSQQMQAILALSRKEREALMQQVRRAREEARLAREECAGQAQELQSQLNTEKETQAQAFREELSALRRRTLAERTAEGMPFTCQSAKDAFLAGAMDALEEDEEGNFTGIDAYKEAFLTRDPSAVAQAGGVLPRIVSGGEEKVAGMTASDFENMSYEERLRLKKRAPALYRTLTRCENNAASCKNQSSKQT